MNRCYPWPVLVVLVLATPLVGAGPPKPFVTGLKNPESVCTGLDGRLYVTVIGERDKDGDGTVVAIDGEKVVPFAEGLNDPRGIAAFRQFFFVADNKRVVRIDGKGKVTVLADETAFPIPPVMLNDVAIDELGTVFVSDSGERKGEGGAVFRIDPKGKVTLVADVQKNPNLKFPNGLLHDSLNHLLFVDMHTGELHRMKIADGSSEKIADGLPGGDGLVYDPFGRLWISSWREGKVWAIPRPGARPVLVADGFQAAADLCFDRKRNQVIVPDMKAGTVTALDPQIPGAEVDMSPLPLVPELAFPDVEWTGWEFEQKGKIVPLRPIVLTHAGDGSNRVFVATQHGQVHVFPNDQAVKKSKLFLDIRKQVRYADNQNEEGFLGLAFHPKFKENGQFFVHYNPKTLTSVVSRFRVSKDDPDRADPTSEEVVLKVERPYWNHAGGTIVFGPDGMLYLVFGDGGLANDPHENGQKLSTLLGKVLRIDVDHKDEGKGYAIPKDNPFVGKPDVRPEIFAYGLRNPWRIAFDKKTGALWCADVGQNLWEEIDILTPGGNYGWNRREGLHPFGAKGVGQKPEYIDPIWEYHHDVGKSITGGPVYRGTRVPELAGHYLYADYVTNKLWALKYDDQAKRVVANRPIPDKGVPVMSFGEDEGGDVYFMTYTGSGKGIYRFANAGK